MEERRRRLGITQEQFAERLDLSVQTLSALENGSRFALMATYLKIADALQVKLIDLFRPEPSNESFEEALRRILAGHSAEEASALLHIMTEIAALLRYYSGQGSNR